MQRSTVLIATTNPAMASALGKRLAKPCRKLGLRLDVCPGGGEQDLDGKKARAYRSAEALFDHLESVSRDDPMGLADTLVVLDVGAGLEAAFEPHATQDDGWHVTSHRAGAAVELILRFPQVFPVILSPAVPVSDEEAKKNKPGEVKIDEVINPTWHKSKDDEWGSFHRICKELCTKHKPGKPDIESCKLLHAFRVPLHFVSPFDGGSGLSSTLARFARGMRCWFDPTGLRTLVKNRFVGTVFGSQDSWKDTQDLRDVLLNRLGQVNVAVDEEREFAMLSAYTAYKYGRRAWIVTTFAEFDDMPLWVAANEKRDTTDVVVLRDIDLRFPDIPDGDKSLARKKATLKLEEEERAPRAQLQTIDSPIWRECFDGENRIGKNWLVRAVSSHPNTIEKFDSRCLLGESGGKYYGFVKPIASLYQLGDVLGVQGGKRGTVLSSLQGVTGESKGGHGAPYLNLAMAESLLQQARHCKDGPVENLLGALLAGEAYELLLGMSKTTALEALLAMHKAEVRAEVEFPGVSHDIRIDKRRYDIEKTLCVIYGTAEVTDNQVKQVVRRTNKAVMNMFLSQFWSELRQVYKNGEQFAAAEAANVESLVHSKWCPSKVWLSSKICGFVERVAQPIVSAWFSFCAMARKLVNVESRFMKLISCILSALWWFPRVAFPKRGWLAVATTFSGWFRAALLLTLLSAAAYGWLLEGHEYKPPDGGVKYESISKGFRESLSNGFGNYLVLLQESVLTSLGATLTDNLLAIVNSRGNTGRVVAIVHIGISYLLFGLLIAMFYRKITRG